MGPGPGPALVWARSRPGPGPALVRTRRGPGTGPGPARKKDPGIYTLAESESAQTATCHAPEIWGTSVSFLIVFLSDLT